MMPALVDSPARYGREVEDLLEAGPTTQALDHEKRC
jgi:hypothetical protein